MKRPMTVAGTVFCFAALCTGIAGLFVPGLPATPFFLLAVWCYAHVSPRFIGWFKRLPVDRSYVDDFVHERSMTKRNKIKTLAVTTPIMLSLFFVYDALWFHIVLAMALVAKYYNFIFCVWTNIEPGHGVAHKEAGCEGKDLK